MSLDILKQNIIDTALKDPNTFGNLFAGLVHGTEDGPEVFNVVTEIYPNLRQPKLLELLKLLDSSLHLSDEPLAYSYERFWENLKYNTHSWSNGDVHILKVWNGDWSSVLLIVDSLQKAVVSSGEMAAAKHKGAETPCAYLYKWNWVPWQDTTPEKWKGIND